MSMEPVMYVTKDGDKGWIANGIFHRTDGPAIMYANGDQVWMFESKCHRLDGPAFIRADSTQAWWVNGKRHRTDGPAIIRKNGDQEWWVNGKDVTKEVNDWMRKQDVVWPWDEEIQAQFILTFS
jgi:hypothetical protein